MAQSEDVEERRRSVYLLCDNFGVLPDQRQAWHDMIMLSCNENESLGVVLTAIDALSIAFPCITDKNHAWEDIHYLTLSKNYGARLSAVSVMRAIFSLIPNKKQAWRDLLRLTKDEKIIVRSGAASALAVAFPYITEKAQILNIRNYLIRLKKDKEKNVRASANYCMGRMCTFKATEAKSGVKFKKELEKAIAFFEEASKETNIFSPANFCLPFYKSYYTIVFRKNEANIHNYLLAAKSAVGRSKTKEKLIEAVENLADALEEAQKISETDFDAMKRYLNINRKYCERAADLLETTEQKAPLATKLVKKGLPIIDERIKELINDVNKDVKTLCDAARGTEAEKYANPICRQVKEFAKIRNPIELEKRVNGLLPNLSFMAENFSDRERDFVNAKVENIRREEYLEDIFVQLNEIIVFITPHIKMSKDMETLEKKLDDIMISLKPGIREELVISVGAEFAGTGAKHEIHIPLQEITYHDIEKDLEKIKGKSALKLSSLPSKLAKMVKSYILRNKKDDLLK